MRRSVPQGLQKVPTGKIEDQREMAGSIILSRPAAHSRIISTIQQFKADFLSGEVSQVNADIAPDNLSGIVANVGLMSSLPIDNNGQLPVTLGMRGD